MDVSPLNSPSLNTLLRSAGLKSDSLQQKNFDEQNFSASFSDKLSTVTTENYEPGQKNLKKPESLYVSLIQPQFQSNTPISKNNNIKKSFLEKSYSVNKHSRLQNSTKNTINLKTAQIYSSSSESIGTGYFVTAPSGNPNILDLVHEQKQMNSKFKIYFDQTKIKGSLLNVTL